MEELREREEEEIALSSASVALPPSTPEAPAASHEGVLGSPKPTSMTPRRSTPRTTDCAKSHAHTFGRRTRRLNACARGPPMRRPGFFREQQLPQVTDSLTERLPFLYHKDANGKLLPTGSLHQTSIAHLLHINFSGMSLFG